MRLNKFIAQHTGISRRDADKLIASNSVQVNDELPQMGYQLKETDTVHVLRHGLWSELKNTPVDNKPTTIIVYKPQKYLVSTESQGGLKTIYDYLPAEYKKLKYAGRLDAMSEGLLVMSSDGNLVNTLTHPKFGSKKVYIVGTTFPLNQETIDRLSKGIMLDGYQTNGIGVERLSKEMREKYSFLLLSPKQVWYVFTLSEGRNQQIRRSLADFGFKVVRLIRVEHGPYQMTQELIKKKILVAGAL
jgi:23S rRNA pseudouridine2605 synthase